MSKLAAAIEFFYPRHQPVDLLRGLCSDILFESLGLPRLHELPEEVRPRLAKAYTEDLKADPFADCLGVAYMELASRGRKRQMGQFFTPAPIARMMARIVAHDAQPLPNPYRICEPSAGSGVMLLAAIEAIVEAHGPAALAQVSINAIDLDYTCALMAAANIAAAMSTLNAPLGELLVLHGNALAPLDQAEIIVHATSPEFPPTLLA